MAENLSKYLEDLENTERGEFKPQHFYDAEADCLTAYFRNAESYARRVTDFLTVFLGMQDDEPVGFQLTGLRKKLLENLGVTVVGGKVRLRLGRILHAVASVSGPAPSEEYRLAEEYTKDFEVEVGEDLVSA